MEPTRMTEAMGDDGNDELLAKVQPAEVGEVDTELAACTLTPSATMPPLLAAAAAAVPKLLEEEEFAKSLLVVTHILLWRGVFCLSPRNFESYELVKPANWIRQEKLLEEMVLAAMRRSGRLVEF
uniref:Uncharacterized protein n=1 Tax=Macrostomum lignano TaxID=282301 RepID=A0A1I8F448_9PLAT